MAARSGFVPKVFEAPVTATNFVLGVNRSVTLDVSSSEVWVFTFAHLTVAPFASAACTQGLIFES